MSNWHVYTICCLLFGAMCGATTLGFLNPLKAASAKAVSQKATSAKTASTKRKALQPTEILAPHEPCVRILGSLQKGPPKAGSPKLQSSFPKAVQNLTPKQIRSDVKSATQDPYFLWNLFSLALRSYSPHLDGSSLVRWPEKSLVHRVYHLLPHVNLYTLNPETGQSLLNKAVQTRSLHMVEALLKLGVDPNFTSPITGDGPFHIMARQTLNAKEKSEVFLAHKIGQALLQAGADLNLTYGLKALDLNEPVLIKIGVRAYVKWKSSYEHSLSGTKHHYPVKTGAKKGEKRPYSKDQMDFLVTLDQKIQNLAGMKPLHMAIEARNLWALRWLLRHGAQTTGTPTQSLAELTQQMYDKHNLSREALLVYRTITPYLSKP